MSPRGLSRRQLLQGAAGIAGLLAMAGCDNLSGSQWFRDVLRHTESLTDRIQRLVTPRNALAQEYAESEISAVFPANGTDDPGTQEYVEMVQNHFVDWRVTIGG